MSEIRGRMDTRQKRDTTHACACVRARGKPTESKAWPCNGSSEMAPHGAQGAQSRATAHTSSEEGQGQRASLANIGQAAGGGAPPTTCAEIGQLRASMIGYYRCSGGGGFLKVKFFLRRGGQNQGRMATRLAV